MSYGWEIYPFAGKYRTVNMSKNGFPFAAADRIADLMRQLEKKFLAKYTPCHYSELNELAYALGIIHVELILIHPFREGNGGVKKSAEVVEFSKANENGMNKDRSAV